MYPYENCNISCIKPHLYLQFLLQFPVWFSSEYSSMIIVHIHDQKNIIIKCYKSRTSFLFGDFKRLIYTCNFCCPIAKVCSSWYLHSISLWIFFLLNILGRIACCVANEVTQADQKKFCKQVSFHSPDLIYIRIFIKNINRSFLSVIFMHCIKHGEEDCW